MRKWILISSAALLLLSTCDHDTSSKTKASKNIEDDKTKKEDKHQKKDKKEKLSNALVSPNMNNQQNDSFNNSNQQLPVRENQTGAANQTESEYANNDDNLGFYYYDHYGRTPEEQRAHERWINDQRRVAEDGKLDIDESELLKGDEFQGTNTFEKDQIQGDE